MIFCPVILFSLCRTSVSTEAMRLSQQMIFIWNRSISIRNGCTLSENSSPLSLSRSSLAITPRWASLYGSEQSHNELLYQNVWACVEEFLSSTSTSSFFEAFHPLMFARMKPSNPVKNMVIFHPQFRIFLDLGSL